jgi:membrane glycosyltransferase
LYDEIRMNDFDPIGKALDIATFIGLLLGAAATAIQPTLLFFAAPVLVSIAVGLFVGWRIKRRYEL